MDEEYDPSKVEPKWQQAWADAGLFSSEVDHDKPKFYCLEMYPYPSGPMHIGHVRNYSIGDSVARYRRARGFNVIYPMGFDSFGMPAENAAIEEGGHPRDITERNIGLITKDFHRMGISHDWSRTLRSHDPSYYRWNQWFFLKFLEQGIAHRAYGTVNWCGDCETVLANEQVENGTCWRCHHAVVDRDMDQWYLRVDGHVQELWDSLDDIDFPSHVKALQKDWMGRSEGALITFPVDGNEGLVIDTFTTRPDTIFGVTFVTLAPENKLCEQLVSGSEYEEDWKQLREETSSMSDVDRSKLKEKKGVFLGRYAINPLNNEKIPIYAGNFVIASYGTGSVMAVPGHDQRDFEFAKRYDIPITRVLLKEAGDDPDAPIHGAFEGYGPMINSSRDNFDGLAGEEAKKAVITELEREGAGNGTIQWKMRDWLISRQRYWGTPIPIIYCDDCGIVGVPEEELPVLLPDDVVFSKEGNPIATSPTFNEVDCPQCGISARRETDTMDTFVDSSWYYMRYTDAGNDEACFGQEPIDYWMNVDFYCGGIEHAQMHLIYARLWTKLLRDIGLLTSDEPFQTLLCQGMVNAQAPHCEECNTTFPVSRRGEGCPNCGDTLGERSAKMSKSLGNTVSPEPIIEKFGADTVRLFILFAAQPTAGMDWSEAGIEANRRHLGNLWNSARSILEWGDAESEVDAWMEARFRSQVAAWIEAMDSAELRHAVSISHYDIYSDLVWYQRRGGSNRALGIRLLLDWSKLLHPATPHFAEELWAGLDGDGLLAAKPLDLDPEEAGGDAGLLAREAFIKSVIDQARQMLELAERHLEGPATSVTFQCAEPWKGELCRIGMELQEEGYDMKQALKVIMTRPFAHDAEVRKQVPAAWKRVLKQLYRWSPGEKAVLRAALDEAEVIAGAADFIREELGVNRLQVHIAGEGEDVGGKARFAFPSEPGIAYL